jgi:hypothetical protein
MEQVAELMQRTRGENLAARGSSSQLTGAESIAALRLELLDTIADASADSDVEVKVESMLPSAGVQNFHRGDSV